ncbi:deoxynucleoside triphosphate triphosphohydrolase SAMHD1-like, partial [Seriola lalandi dorsalis]|uniref:deoxynucleoside triphosphate triphosphohydrolase SAMHD1-like n=1 Tax=Seriola lalandi dorsalis TaxID=1841481 RepID=UPI000C6F5E17
HGPFSHLFDGMFIPKAGKKWKHEKASQDMFDHMVKCNALEEKMKKYGLEPEQDMLFIKEMIGGRLDSNKQKEWPYEGRDKDKSFLYEIVANKTNGIDVDKFDYFARDCHHLGIQNHFDHHRFFKFARVCEVEGGGKHICSRDKEMHNLYAMFYARCSFHRKAYQHKVNKLIETMISEAFVKADKHIKIKGSGGKIFTLSTAIDDMEAYTKLTDRVFEDILHSSSPELEDARKILNRIITRDLYKCVAKVETGTAEITKEVIQKWEDELAKEPDRLTPDDFEVVTTSLDYGNKDEDPISCVYFYSKNEPNKAFQCSGEKVSRLLPKNFSEKFIRIYCKTNDENSLDVAKDCVRRWFREYTILE